MNIMTNNNIKLITLVGMMGSGKTSCGSVLAKKLGISFLDIDTIIELEENLKINEIFLEIDKEPISAASLGQVHKAKLKNEEIVAIKVQRPGLREQITLDLYIVRNIAYWLKNNIGLIRSDLVALIDELGKRVFEEMDYLNEAENAEKFRNMHRHNQMIAVPKIYKEMTSRRVLTMEWIDGTKLTNLEEVKKGEY